MDIYNDTFMEYLIKRKKDTKDTLLSVLVVLGAIVVSIGIFMLTLFVVFQTHTGDLGFSLGLLVIAAAWYCAYLLMTTMNVEWEYILTNSEMDIDKVMSKKGRKHIVSWDFKNIDICARTDDPEHKYEYENSESRDKIEDLTGDKSRGGVYFVDYTDDKGTKMRVLFQPTLKMINTAKKYNMRKVFVIE
ncbi:MAG: hypothetical protein IJT23_06650 [Clostridia bacterium]|nr:hypothetical protein [Clostridia bacterium]